MMAAGTVAATEHGRGSEAPTRTKFTSAGGERRWSSAHDIAQDSQW